MVEHFSCHQETEDNNLCWGTFPTIGELDMHYRNVHGYKSRGSCKMCPVNPHNHKQPYYAKDLIKHLGEAHSSARYRCSVDGSDLRTGTYQYRRDGFDVGIDVPYRYCEKCHDGFTAAQQAAANNGGGRRSSPRRDR